MFGEADTEDDDTDGEDGEDSTEAEPEAITEEDGDDDGSEGPVKGTPMYEHLERKREVLRQQMIKYKYIIEVRNGEFWIRAPDGTLTSMTETAQQYCLMDIFVWELISITGYKKLRCPQCRQTETESKGWTKVCKCVCAGVVMSVRA